MATRNERQTRIEVIGWAAMIVLFVSFVGFGVNSYPILSAASFAGAAVVGRYWIRPARRLHWETDSDRCGR